MKSKLTILLAVLLLAVLAMPQSAEAQGWNVSRPADVATVIFGGDNQQVSHIDFNYEDADDEDVAIKKRSTGDTAVTVTYGDLMITSRTRASQSLTAPQDGDAPTDNFDVWCITNPGADNQAVDACTGDSQPRATIANDKNGKGSITITFPAAFSPGDTAAGRTVRLAYVRLDVSGEADKADVPISIKRGADASVPLGGGAASGAVSGVVGVVAMGMAVTADPAAGLACAGSQDLPTVTVTEGFKGAWAPKAMYVNSDGESQSAMSPMIKIMLDGFPDEGKVEWPEDVEAKAKVDGTTEVVVGMLTIEASDSKTNGQEVVYSYTPHAAVAGDDTVDPPVVAVAANDAANKFLRSFGITPTKHNFSGDQSLSVMAMLYPMSDVDAKGNKAGLMARLSFSAPAVAPEKGKGEEWLVLSECVTYLLYPFVTCGATAGWDTGISVSNTSADGNIFGAFDETKQQDGSVVMYGFPKERKLSAVEGEDGERMVEPIVSTVSSALMAGETITFQCSNTTMAGMEGYAIIRAGFQHARGMGFVVGNFADGASLDVAHGYIAEVITDPATRSDELK
jgi:hypothetical protein